ncbi:penicillin-binding protein activator [Alteromonas pelagimontana]|uniref:Penicillin-binding protein activator n=1 Tax=Alteromonas pelagimontana TaxID=1858656 RepID=A0A6M4MD81_9ALTE|nr:penicillin-binding protein activator [Alteromonas pelagimontana]QJR80086.1 penicillin-binding protein activator [Alteromonas pelagimontana]
MRLVRFSRFLAQFMVIALMLSLFACSSSRAPQSSRPIVSQPNLPNQPKVITETPESLISQAQEAWQQDHNGDKRNQLLMDAATSYLQEGKLAQAQQILVSIESGPLSTPLRLRANMLIAKSYLQSPDADSEELLALVSPLAADDEVKAQQLAVQTELYQRQQDWLGAANAYVQSVAPTEESVARTWQWVNMASREAFPSAESQFPALEPFLALRQLIQESGLQPRQLQQALNQFKQVFRGSPIVEYWPQELDQAVSLNPPSIDQIVVLLPLSGRLESTGLAVKEGILAAYYQTLEQQNRPERQPTLKFVDTVNKNAEELVASIGDSRWVIGPLLKENVDAINSVRPVNINMLALNRLDELQQEGTQEGFDVPRTAYFALAPEDEAYQLADHIFHHGYRAPILISAKNTINQRMHEAFELRWQQLNKNDVKRKHVNLTTVTFTDSSSLREGITEALDVAQSKSRINQIEYMVNEELYNVPRNRRDVDAIVVFASPEQTELLNPMIEASLSPFNGKTVPVYATSRSMEYDSGKNQWRDLQNVRFIDMPWMLPEHQWQSLSQQTAELWPQRSTQTSRFFAFGVDAYNLLPYLPNLALLPQVTVAGLTGELSMNKSREIIRLLPQAVIDNEKIKPLAE